MWEGRREKDACSGGGQITCTGARDPVKDDIVGIVHVWGGVGEAVSRLVIEGSKDGARGGVDEGERGDRAGCESELHDALAIDKAFS